MKKLNEILESALNLHGPNFYKNRVPEIVYKNLNKNFNIRPYQEEAFGRFIYYWTNYNDRPKGLPTHLLYHMATGSGKTLIMAGIIIYLYHMGYRNFLFFVNSTNIIEKTKDNFLNKISSKYLFAETINISNRIIDVNELDNFEAANSEDINLVFTTIQGLYSRLNTPRENSITYEDFKDQKIVLISDEAHHINAETKKGRDLTKDELFEVESWETTVNRIFRANPQNMLLEFTATVDFTNPDIASKYNDKVIFDYPLKQFRIDGYSKDVKVLQAELDPFERVVQAIILSQYRRKLFEKYGKSIKPVLLIKSKTIKESEDFFEEFTEKLNKLTSTDLEKIRDNALKYDSGQLNLSYGKTERALLKAFRYFVDNKISLDNLIEELKNDFNEEKCISVNSKDESEKKQIAVNSLEELDNEYRAVFAVDKLNEGWDVLNLFDIVRLYDTRDAKAGKPGRTTMSEAQLIGRGARYCPFKISDDQPLYQRKYDEDVEHELKLCEELFYHSSYNPKYIQELNTALEEVGIKPKNTSQIELNLKDSFKETEFYKTGLLFLNKQSKYNREDIFTLKSSIRDTLYKYSIKSGYTRITEIFEDVSKDNLHKKTKDITLSELGNSILRKAVNKLVFYRFDNLRTYLPNLSSMSEFINSKDYLSNIKVELTGTKDQIDNLTPDNNLAIAISVLESISHQLVSDKIEYKGTEKFEQYFIKDRIKDKVVNYSIDDDTDKETGKAMSISTETSIYLDLSNKNWYAFNDNYGTSEEKYFVKYIDKVYDKLKDKFNEIYLVRNERHFKLYNFDDGRAIEPDFVLFLIKYKTKEAYYYQLFIEPKGAHLIKQDEWKENFLKSLKEKDRVEQLWKGKKYTVWGMPFYNNQKENDFDQKFKQQVIALK